jgi:hypothetical protein
MLSDLVQGFQHIGFILRDKVVTIGLNHLLVLLVLMMGDYALKDKSEQWMLS